MMDVVPLPTSISTLTVDLLRPDAPVENTGAAQTDPDRKNANAAAPDKTDAPTTAGGTDRLGCGGNRSADRKGTAPAGPTGTAQHHATTLRRRLSVEPCPPTRRFRGAWERKAKVVLRVHVEPNGRPAQIEIKTSSGSPCLDNAAQDAVWRWKFVPARRGDEAISAWVLVPITFNLKN